MLGGARFPPSTVGDTRDVSGVLDLCFGVPITSILLDMQGDTSILI